MRLLLRNQTAQKNLNNQLMHNIKKMVDEKNLEVSLEKLLAISRVDKKRFAVFYRDQSELIQALNHTFVSQLKEDIPCVRTKEDLVMWTDKLIEMTKSASFLAEAKTIFLLNKKAKQELLHSLKQDILHILDIRMNPFFEKLKQQTTVLNVEEFKGIFYSVMEESIVNNNLRNFQLLIYSLNNSYLL